MDLSLFSAVLVLLSLGVEAEREDVSTRIIRANKGIRLPLVQGDVDKIEDVHPKWERGHSSDPNVEVPYTIARYFGSSQRQTIYRAIDILHQKTCVRFVPRTNQRAYVKIVNHGGCFSSVGRQGGAQVLSLAVPDCIHQGVILHQLLHALGFGHEHTRPDRDHFVEIKDGMKKHFAINKYDKVFTNMKIPYDYTSIMHYGSTAYGKDTMAAIKHGYINPSEKIGQSDDLSHNDVLRIKTFYNCRASN